MYSKQHTVQYMPNSDSSGCLSLSSLSVLTSMTPPCDQIAFLAKMGTKNDRNDMDLKEAEDIKKRWQKHTEELCKKELHDPDNHHGVTTHQTSWNAKSSGP